MTAICEADQKISSTISVDFHFNEAVENELKNNYCNPQISRTLGSDLAAVTRFSSLLKLVSTPPRFTTVRVNTLRIPLEEAKAMLTDIIKQQYSKKCCPLPKVHCHPVLHETLIISCDEAQKNIAEHPKKVIVDLKCGEAVLRGSDVFIPGVMAAPSCMQEGDSVSIFVDLRGFCRRGLTKSFDGPKMFAGNGIALVSRHDIFCNPEKTRGTAIVMTEPIYDSPCLNGALPDSLFLQNLPSIVCSRVLNPQPKDLVLDMCAAPGGKATHLATLMNNQSVLIAVDKTKPKVEKIRSNIKRLGLSNIYSFVYDSCRSVDLFSTGKSVLLGPPFSPDSFDKIILDAPCSALGQRPQLYNKINFKELQSYQRLQKKLFIAAVQLLKCGGVLVYSTCTLTLAENENMVQWALDNFHELELKTQAPYLGSPGLPGSNLSEENRQLVQRFGFDIGNTSWDQDTIGFFIAKFRKAKKFVQPLMLIGGDDTGIIKGSNW